MTEGGSRRRGQSVYAGVEFYLGGIRGLSGAAEPTEEQAARDRIARAIEKLDRVRGARERVLLGRLGRRG